MTDRVAPGFDRRARLIEARELRFSGRLAESSALLQELLRRNPMDVEAIAEGGFLALENGDHQTAEQVLLACRQFFPLQSELLEGAGEAAYRARAVERAVQHLSEAVTMAPSRVAARLSLGQMLCSAGRAEEGIRELQRCFALPTTPGSEDGFRLALMRIALGEEASGWREFAGHWEAAQERHLRSPRWWRGESIRDEDLYLLSSGGLGDSILLARFIPDAVQRARQVVLGVPPVLARLLGSTGARTDWSGVYADIPPNAVLASFWHLPSLLGAPGIGGRHFVPYLTPPVDCPRLAARDRPRVGLAWAGARRVSHDADRSPPSLAALGPMLEVDGVSWVGLHPDARLRDEGVALGIAPLPPVRDLADTAGILSQLDLVITVDSAVANLAGALGIPTWVMTPTLPELRWPPGAASSPWYPHARLFRRRHMADWTRLATDIRAALLEWLAAPGGAAPRTGDAR